MSQPVLQLTSQGNWTQIYDESRTAIQATPAGGHIPIPAFEIPFLFDKHVIAVRCLSPSAKATWRFAGTLSQRFQAGTGGTASPLPTVDASSLSLRLNRTLLVIFKKYTQEYQLLFESPPWIKDMRLSIWQYIGAESDSTEDLIRDLFGVE
jgi:hypothetical protein